VQYINISTNRPYSYGSGATYFKKIFNKLPKDEIYSRDIFQAFWKAIDTTTDTKSGGVVQLVGLYRNGKSKTFGIVNNNESFIYGQKISSLDIPLDIEWRNQNFEEVNIKTMKIKDHAQRQPFNKKL